MAILEIKNLSFQFEGAQTETLADISFSVQAGEFVLICGPSGCGKTTLLRHLIKELQPYGKQQGEILFKGKAFSSYMGQELVHYMGMVMQDPENQIVTDHVQSELAFGLENIGLPADEIRQRMAEMCNFFGMESWLRTPIDECSGGQKQIVNLASILMLQPDVIILDEPTAQLDPVAARELISMVHRLNQEFGLTIIMTEHRLEDVFPLADHIMMLNKGAIQYEGPPRQVIQDIWEKQDSVYHPYLPSISRLYVQLGGIINHLPKAGRLPLTVKEGREWYESVTSKSSEMQPSNQVSTSTGETLLKCQELFFRYDKKQPLVLNHCSLEVISEEFLAILGGNGAGKSTLLQLMLGLLTPQHGKIKYQGLLIDKMKPAERFRDIGYLAQNPMLYFAHDTVEKELLHAAEQQGYPDPLNKVEEMLKFFELTAQRHTHPHDCSSGERQKTALASVLMSKPQLLLLDEPTKGMDPAIKLQLGRLLSVLREQGMTIVMVTHDVEFSAAFASRCMMLFNGEITTAGAPPDFFSGNLFYTTTINRVVRSNCFKALSVEDVCKVWEEKGH